MSNDCTTRNMGLYYGHIINKGDLARLNILKEFISNRKPCIDLGCGAYTPIYLNVTHACDNGEVAWKILKKNGWKGEFKKCNVYKTSYLDKQFKAGVCSEVIEHIPTEDKIKRTFLEIDRICEKWLFTTPSRMIPDKDHKFFFTGDHLFDIIPFNRKDYIIIKKGIFFYISNDIKRICKIMGVKNE